MQRMSGPLPGGGWIEDAASLARLYEYCRQDVRVERALFHRLPPLSDAEQELWTLDAVINARGFFTDGALLEKASHLATAIDRDMQRELADITAGAVTSTDKVAKLQAWLGQRGCEVKDVTKGVLRSAQGH